MQGAYRAAPGIGVRVNCLERNGLGQK